MNTAPGALQHQARQSARCRPSMITRWTRCAALSALLVGLVGGPSCGGPASPPANAPPTDPPPAAVPIPPGTSVADMFPGSLKTVVYPPRALDPSEVEYIVWISGADREHADLIRRWATAIAESGPQRIKERFETIDAMSSEVAGQRSKGPASPESAAALEALYKQRDRLAEQVLNDEAQALRESLPPESADDPSRGIIVGRALLAREGDAVSLQGRLSGDLNPQVLRLLHRAATDPRTSSDQAAALRRHALEIAARVLEERRNLLRSYLQMICRVADAHVLSVQRHEDPHTLTIPIYRAMSLSAQRLTTINMELLGALPEMVPAEVAAEIRHAYHEQAFGAVSEDVFGFTPVAAFALQQLAGDALAQSTAEIQANTLARWRLLDDLGREFGEEQMRCFERAHTRDRAAGDRFLRRLALVQDRALAEAQETLARLRARALEANPGWDTAAFDHAVSAWRAEVLVRRDLPLQFGHLSEIVLPDQIEQVLTGRGRGSPGSAR